MDWSKLVVKQKSLASNKLHSGHIAKQAYLEKIVLWKYLTFYETKKFDF